MKNKNKIITVIACIAIFIAICITIINQNKKTSPTTTTSEQALVSFVIDGKKQSITDVQNLSLPNGKTLYFGLPNDFVNPSGAYCGSGGCQYSFYVGDNISNIKRVIGFGEYNLDCNTNKISFSSDKSGEVFGFPQLDTINRIIKIYYHLSANLGTENIYHIDDSGSPTLIASYDNTCSDKVITLFRDSYFPRDLTNF